MEFRLISQLTDLCVDEFYSREIYSKKTGKQITKESDSFFGRTPIEGACKAKVKMLLDGYSIYPYIDFDDVRKYIALGRRGFKHYYKEKLKCEANPKCIELR